MSAFASPGDLVAHEDVPSPGDTVKPTADARRAAWERATTVPLTALSIVFLVAYSWRVLGDRPAIQLDSAAKIVDIVIWVVFAADFVVRCHLSESAWKFVRTRPIELLVVLLPGFRPARAAMVLLGTSARHATRTRLALTVISFSLLLVYLCSLAMYDAERGADGATVHDFGDALWWSAVSVTTVGYGDQYPVTLEGRLVALVLMALGIGLIGFATATAASWLIDKLHTTGGTVDGTVLENNEILRELRKLRTEMRALCTEFEYLDRSVQALRTGSPEGKWGGNCPHCQGGGRGSVGPGEGSA